MAEVTPTAFGKGSSPPAAPSLWPLAKPGVKEAVSEGRCLVTAPESSSSSPFFQPGGTREKGSSVQHPHILSYPKVKALG